LAKTYSRRVLICFSEIGFSFGLNWNNHVVTRLNQFSSKAFVNFVRLRKK